MILFLAADLHELVTDLMRRIIKVDVLDQHKGAEHLLNLKDPTIYMDPSKVDVGFEAKLSSVTKQASDKQRYTFRMDCLNMIKNMVGKVLEKCPIKSALVRSLDWLNPCTIAATEKNAISDAEQALARSLEILADHKRVKPSECDAIRKQYRKLNSDVLSFKQSDKDRFTGFNKNDENQRIDTLLEEFVAPNYPALWDVVSQLLLLSHGQASVERGFSVHKQTTVENISKDGLKSRRLILQAVRAAGGAENVSQQGNAHLLQLGKSKVPRLS